MKETNSVYLEIDYIDSFLRKKPHDQDSEEYRLWYEQKNHLLRKSILTCNLSSPEKFREYGEISINAFLNLLSSSPNIPKWNKKPFNILRKNSDKNQNIPFNSIFLTQGINDALQNKSKYLISDNIQNNNDWNEISYNLDHQFVIPLKEKNTFKWIDYKRYMIAPTNEIIISDRYLFKGNYKENVISLLKVIKLDQVKHSRIIIFTKHPIVKDSGQLIEFLESEIENVSVTLVLMENRAMHDRVLISNYFGIEAPYGFTFIDKGKITIQSSSLIFHSFTNIQQNKSVINNLEELYKIYKNQKMNNMVIGDSKNPIDLFKFLENEEN